MSQAVFEEKVARSHLDREQLPEHFPTHRHSAMFWESLGRTVATFGVLEETLGKAVFSLTVGQYYAREEEAHAAYQMWLQDLQQGPGEPLVNLADSYAQMALGHPDSEPEAVEQLVADIRRFAALRKVLCHGAWQTADEAGDALPMFVDRSQNIFGTPVDIDYMERVRRHVVDQICCVIDSVTRMGWTFPGDAGLGKRFSDATADRA